MAMQEFQQSGIDPVVEARRRASLTERPAPLPKYRRAVFEQSPNGRRGELTGWEVIHRDQQVLDGSTPGDRALPPLEGRFSAEMQATPGSGTGA